MLVSVKEIVPQIITATKNGHLKWSLIGKNDYVTRIKSYKVEIELRMMGSQDSSDDADAVAIFLWNEENTIVDSYYAIRGSNDYIDYHNFFNYIEKSNSKVPSILSDISSYLKDMI